MNHMQQQQRDDEKTRRQRVMNQMVADVFAPSLKDWELMVDYMHRHNWVPKLSRHQTAQACLGIMLEAHGEPVSWQ